MQASLEQQPLVRQFMADGYRLKQKVIAMGLALWGRTWHSLFNQKNYFIPRKELVDLFYQRFEELLSQDIKNAEEGYYPYEVLYSLPLRDYIFNYLGNFDYQLQVLKNRLMGTHNNLPENIDLDKYPAYYRRTFHWQADGWFSDKSAALYDTGVEFLFGGTADIMRRMALPAIFDHIQTSSPAKVLDLACGTGRFLKLLSNLRPGYDLTGLDLSPFYLKYAAGSLPNHVKLLEANAEQVPLPDEQFDVINSTFLFHELPPSARKNVIQECYRLLKPGGMLTITDSIQLKDSPEFEPFMEFFARTYHEPFYMNYVKDSLENLVESSNFKVQSSEPWLYAKVVSARKQ